jgi:hypothetical protein
MLLLGLGSAKWRPSTRFRPPPAPLHAELTLDEAASLLGVDPLELEWAIEEDGVCSTIDDQGKNIVAAGDEWRLK